MTLMTLHAAKGLEFPAIFIVGLEDGILPHERSSSDDDEIEEERRLLFVGITRAEEQLQVSRCMNRFRRGSYWPAIASRFLMEFPREEMQIFEPVSNRIYDEESLADSIDDLDPWMHDGIPSYDINEDSPADSECEPNEDSLFDRSEFESDDSDVVREPVATFQSDNPEFPKLVTAAQLQAKQEAMTSHVRLHPEAYKVDMRVEHPEYGMGVIVSITGKESKRTATVDFEKLGKKRFRLAFCNLRVH